MMPIKVLVESLLHSEAAESMSAAVAFNIKPKGGRIKIRVSSLMSR